MLQKYFAIRRQLANAWLPLPEDELARQYAADAGATYRDVCNSGLQYQAPLPTDIEFRAGLIRLLGEKSPPAPGTLLAAQLYLAPP